MKSMRDNSILWIALIVCITIFCYRPVLKSDFINWDDNWHLTGLVDVQSLSAEHIKNIFSSAVNLTYIPLTILSFAIEYHFCKLNPFVYHLDNLFLHLGVVILIFFFALHLGLTKRAAGLAALLFAIHPMHVESIAWVTERKDTLYASFYMLALLCYMRYIEQCRGKFIFYILSIIFGLLSMLAKPMALSLPLIFFLLDWFKRRRFSIWILAEKIPYVLYIEPLAGLNFSLNLKTFSAVFDPLNNLLIYIWTFTFYPVKFIFPCELIPIYFIPKPVAPFNGNYAWSIIVFIIVVWALVRYHRNRLWIFSVGFYFFSIFFLSSSF